MKMHDGKRVDEAPGWLRDGIVIETRPPSVDINGYHQCPSHVDRDAPVPRQFGCSMSLYRCFRTSDGDHIVGVEVFESSTDLEACARARKAASEDKWDGYQLWHGDRRVFCDGFDLQDG
jgi:hypothetical protein